MNPVTVGVAEPQVDGRYIADLEKMLAVRMHSTSASLY